MTTSTPLPEQGDFNEKLDKILSDMAFRCAGGITDDGRKEYEPAAIAIRTLVLEEIIGEGEDPVYASAGSITRKNIIEYQNTLRDEQRKKLGGTHGTK